MGFSTLSVGWITAIRILKFFDHDFFQLPPKIRVAAGLDESLDPPAKSKRSVACCPE
jgi:hypothetical protein